MRLRRFLGLLTSAAMLHLSAAAGEAACPPHAADGHQPATSRASAPSEHVMGMDRHAMPAADVPVMDAARGAQVNVPPCEVPAVQHCCDALVGCGSAGVAGERQRLASGVRAAGRIHDAPGDAPASFAPAPEPPPPKL
jgi:hypothetical protein